jgi:hypothetical protein
MSGATLIEKGRIASKPGGYPTAARKKIGIPKFGNRVLREAGIQESGCARMLGESEFNVFVQLWSEPSAMSPRQKLIGNQYSITRVCPFDATA